MHCIFFPPPPSLTHTHWNHEFSVLTPRHTLLSLYMVMRLHNKLVIVPITLLLNIPKYDETSYSRQRIPNTHSVWYKMKKYICVSKWLVQKYVLPIYLFID